LLELYDAYQAALNPDGARSFGLRVGEVSFHVADMRSRRTRLGDAGRLMPEP
jgi:hypothetical protein